MNKIDKIAKRAKYNRRVFGNQRAHPSYLKWLKLDPGSVEVNDFFSGHFLQQESLDEAYPMIAKCLTAPSNDHLNGYFHVRAHQNLAHLLFEAKTRGLSHTDFGIIIDPEKLTISDSKYVVKIEGAKLETKTIDDFLIQLNFRLAQLDTLTGTPHIADNCPYLALLQN